MSNLQITWIVVGVITGIILLIPVKRCLATHNGIISMLIGSLMGIFTVSHAWIAILISLCFFSFGFYKNHHKYVGVIQHDSRAE